MSVPTKSELASKVLQIVASIKGVSPESLQLDATFDELGIDSLDRTNILFDLENEFNLDIPDDVTRSISSINGIVARLTEYLQRQTSGAV
jgi:acyl carrier protein